MARAAALSPFPPAVADEDDVRGVVRELRVLGDGVHVSGRPAVDYPMGNEFLFLLLGPGAPALPAGGY